MIDRGFRLLVIRARDAAGYAIAHPDNVRAQDEAIRAAWDAADADPNRRHKIDGRR